MRRFTIPFMTLVLLVSGCSEAKEAAPKIIEPTKSVPAQIETLGNWTVAPAESHITFTATQQGESFTGEFPRYRIVINFNEEALEDANVTARIDLGAVKAGSKDRNGALPGKEWFYVKTFPDAVFQSDDFVKTGEGAYEARGTLTMKGTSQPLTLPFTLDNRGTKADMQGNLTLDRTLWDIGSGSWANGEWVGTEVEIDIKIHAESLF